jgi:hypothetical protein
LGCCSTDGGSSVLGDRDEADDVSVPERFMWKVEFMEKHPEVGVLGGAVD